MTTQTTRTIDLTPTWEEILGLLIAGLTHGTAEGRSLAEQELRRMAQAADHGVSLVKAAEAAKEATRQAAKRRAAQRAGQACETQR